MTSRHAQFASELPACADIDAETSASLVAGVRRVTWGGLACNVGLSIVKGVIGWWSGSRALIADAAHSVSDLATDIAVLVGVRYWAAPADAEHPHGHRKVETVITTLIGVAVGAVGVGIGWNAILALYALAVAEGGAGVVPDGSAAVAAAVSVLVKEWLYRWTAREGRRLRSSALVANAWHHRTDAFSSVPVLLAVVAARIGERQGIPTAFLDPLAAVLVAAMIFRSALSIVRGALASLLDAGVDVRRTARLRAAALSTSGVRSIHAFRTRRCGVADVSVDLHVLVDGDVTVRRGHTISEQVRRRLMDEDASVVEALIHIEPDDAWERVED